MKEELKEYGLSPKEIDVYLACLQAGSSTANRISELTTIRRSTVYEVLETLKAKGIITSSIKEKKYYFSAASPKKLLDILQQKKTLVQSILPQLNALQDSSQEKPTVEVYEGRTGLKNACLDMLDAKEILSYGGNGWLDHIFGTFTENFAQKRVAKKITLKAVIEQDVPKHMITGQVAKITKVKTLKQFKKMNTNVFVYNDCVLTIVLAPEILSMKVTSKEFAQTQRVWFDLFWKIAK